MLTAALSRNLFSMGFLNREEIGRRYATILRKGEIKIFINEGKCEAYELAYGMIADMLSERPEMFLL